MRLLNLNENGELSLLERSRNSTPEYAILSHTWGPDEEEVTYEDLIRGTGKHKPGYEKIRFCGHQAKKDGLQYFWIDTCCINKQNYAELSHAINSMFLWYRNATRCYAYLSDVPTRKAERDIDSTDIWESDIRKSRWFTRGWTLQELIAPTSVEFFSIEGKRLGDKNSLWKLIHEITGISKSALQGDPLSRFSINVRMSWISTRQTTLQEDKAYSLLGIFGVYIPLRYGEGVSSAFKRLQEEIDRVEKCLRDLRITDPRDDKKRIEDTKGGLLENSYLWILENSDFQQWYSEKQNRLLWIKGDPGKGKTMLLCGIVNELKKSITKSDLLSYFFCQATDSRINNAVAVLRGLIYLLVDRQPSLISYVRKKYDHAGKEVFEDANAWVALSEIFINILQDPSLNSTYLIVDALDECVVDLAKLLALIVQTSVSPHVKWIISSRNWPSIEKNLDTATQKVMLCLELNEKSVSSAVAIYIQFKVDWLAKRNRYENDTRDVVQNYLSLNARGTFLWVALVCQELANVSEWKAQIKLTAFAPGLSALYQRMTNQICDSEDANLCKRILAVVSVAYRPVTLDELTSIVEMPKGVSGNDKALLEIIGLCGSFLTVRERTVFFVHQSAKDFLLKEAFYEIFPSGVEDTHRLVASKSLQIMSERLRRDIYNLSALGYSIERVEVPSPDPLTSLCYSCIYWVDHFCDWNPSFNSNYRVYLQNGGVVDKFIREKYLYWLEALSLCRNMSNGVVSMAKLQALLQVIVISLLSRA
jgi:NACHT domain/Heterokaryon incompatibility protein (HET)